MTSSNYFSLTVIGGAGRELFRRRVDALELPLDEPEEITLSADQLFSLQIHHRLDCDLRVSLGAEVIANIGHGENSYQVPSRAWFWNEFGSSTILIERSRPQSRRRHELVFSLPVRIEGRPSVLGEYRRMMEDLQRIHETIAFDVVGRSVHRHGISSDAVQALRPDAVLQALREMYHRMSNALEVVAKQPSTGLIREVSRVTYRGGERIDLSSAQAVVADPLVALDRHGRVLRLGKLRVRRPAITQDLPEHRQIAQGLRDLAARAHLIGHHCQRSIEQLELETQRWGHTRNQQSESVFEQRDLPRIEGLREVAIAAPELGRQFLGLLESCEFLAEAGSPRIPFGPTPLFLGRPEYRVIYETLLEARQSLGILVDGDQIRIAYRDLATLFEYWCFMNVVNYLRDRFGPPSSRKAFEVIDHVYRPDLSPGQSFRFQLPDGSLTCRYNPEFHNYRIARKRTLPLCAMLTNEPLRPDITIELNRSGKRLVMLVLDAKSTDQFSPRQFREMSDYSRQIVDSRSGYQPVRQVFLLHRGFQQRPIVNIPNYFERGTVDRNSSVLGAVDCSPRTEAPMPRDLQLMIDRFLELYLELVV